MGLKIKYQWIKGDDFGKVVEFDREDDKFTYFIDGTKIFSNVKSEFLMLINDDNPELPVNKTQTEATKIANEDRSDPVKVETKISPIMDLLTKLKSNKTKVNIEIDISLPPASLYDIMKEAFGDEVDFCIESYAINSIDKESIFLNVEKTIINKVKKFIKLHKKEVINE